MPSKLATEISAHIDQAYRDLVRRLADNQAVKVSAAIEVLTMAQRTTSQLDADVDRLQARRNDAAKLQGEVADLDEQVSQAAEEYRTAADAETEAKQALDLVASHGKPDDLEHKKQVNERRHVLADRQAESKAAFAKVSSLRSRRDRLRAELTERLQATADNAGDWQDPENFALVRIP